MSDGDAVVAANDSALARAGRVAERVKTESPWRKTIRLFLRHRLAVTGLVVFLIIGGMALFAPIVATHNPNTISLTDRNLPPSSEHFFGTDRTGRDTFSRTVYAGRVSLAVGLAAVTISITLGTLLGAVAGYFGGWIDTILMRLTDVMMTFPPVIIILTVAAIAGPGVGKTILVIGLLNWPIPSRLVRAKFMSLREQEFIHAAQALGVDSSRTIRKHLLPNAIDVLIVYASLGVASAILLEAGISFLGAGVQPPTPSWGNMLNVARNVSVLENDPWLWMPAGVAVVLTVLAVNFIGDGLRDAFDPRARR
ncbi:MAG: ABC transporter permease [Thermomicrobiales bacterium]|nr:ABC transporter permease [Thermomicrobiales bacterium]